MKLIKLKASSNSLRHKIKLQKNLLCKNNKLIKTLLLGTKSWSGRSSSYGRITVRHKGGACKKLFRVINFTNLFFFAIVLGIIYDPNRNIFISLNYNLETKQFFHTSGVNKVTSGSLLICQETVSVLQLGFRLNLNTIPVGALIHNIAINKNSLVKYIRSAGTYGQLLQKNNLICKVKLPSGLILSITNLAYATLGILTNLTYNKIVLGKAGVNRLKGIRPSVRGIAMNPVDHPHGGRANGGCHPMTPWGKPTRGYKTKK